MTVPLPPLTGRDQELAGLGELLDALDDGPRLLLLTGEAGTGKSRLLTELADRARVRALPVISVSASENEQHAPFGLLRDLLNAPPIRAALEELPATTRDDLRPVLDGATPDLPGDARHGLHRAAATLIAEAAQQSKLVLAIDELHWADEASAEALAHLGERPPLRTLLALAYRPHQLGFPAARSIDGIARPGSHRMELGPLTRAQADEIMPAELPAEACEQVWQDSLGNPFYLGQLLAERSHHGAAGPVDARRVPPAVAASTAREIGRLSETARLVLNGAAVCGDVFEPDLAGFAAELDSSAALNGLDELLERDIARQAAHPSRFCFRHSLLRRAVYEQSPAVWRLQAHRRVFDSLAARGAPPELVASHIERFAVPGDLDSVDLLERAAATALRRAPHDAARWYRCALELLPSVPELARRRREDQLAQADALTRAGRLDAAAQAFRDLLDELPPGDPERDVPTSALASVEHLLGRHDDAQRLLAHLPGSPGIQARLSLGAFLTADWPAVRRGADAALDVGGLAEPQRAAAVTLLGVAAYEQGHTSDARRHAHAAADLVDALGDGDLLAEVETLTVLAWAELILEQVDASREHARRATRIAAQHHLVHLIGASQVVEARGLLAKGAFDEAARLAEEAIEASRLSGNRLFMTWALAARSQAQLQRGELEKALELAQQANQAAELSTSPWAGVAAPCLAEALLEAGQASRCLEVLLNPDGQLRPLPSRSYLPGCYETLARAERELGRMDRAHDWVARAAAAAGELDLPGARSVAARCQAELAFAEGQTDQASSLAEEALNHARSAHLPMEQARCRLTRGLVNAGSGLEHGLGELRGAQQELAALGALRYSEQADRVLAELSTAPPSAEDTVATLSARELQVAELVAEGHTNRVIAARLGLSASTINNHLQRIFRRLEISSRDQLSAMMHGDRG